MTNNDELAIKLKAAADKATADEWIHDGDGEIKILSNKLDVARVWSDLCNRNNDAEFIATANPANILALLEERDADKKRIAEEVVYFEKLRLRIAELQTISTAAEKLVRCKGRYHSEQNYRALAALFGVKTPDLPPLETEARTVSVKLPKASIKRRNWTTWDWIEHLGGRYQNGNPGDYIEFGSVYAVQQMLKQFARTVYAQCQSDVVAQIEKQLAESGIKLEVGE